MSVLVYLTPPSRLFSKWTTSPRNEGHIPTPRVSLGRMPWPRDCASYFSTRAYQKDGAETILTGTFEFGWSKKTQNMPLRYQEISNLC